MLYENHKVKCRLIYFYHLHNSIYTFNHLFSKWKIIFLLEVYVPSSWSFKLWERSGVCKVDSILLFACSICVSCYFDHEAYRFIMENFQFHRYDLFVDSRLWASWCSSINSPMIFAKHIIILAISDIYYVGTGRIKHPEQICFIAFT